MSDFPSNKNIEHIQKELYREELMRLHDIKRGSKIKPFNLEPFPHDVSRTSGEYTAADRVLRKQYLGDQLLSAREPVAVPELFKPNFFKRTWNGFFESIFRFGSPKTQQWMRWSAPKLVGALTVAWITWYHIKYDPNKWDTGTKGVYVMQYGKPASFPGDEGFPHKYDRKDDDFCDKGFKSRNVIVGDKLVTSGPE